MSASGRIVIVAGYRRSPVPVIYLNELARRTGGKARVVGVVCASEYSLARIRGWRRRFGPAFGRKIASSLGLGGGGAFDHERKTLLDRAAGEGGEFRPLPARCNELGIPFRAFAGINTAEAIDWMRGLEADFAISAGGGILRRRFIEAIPQGVLNVHSGPLPHVRGMSAVEWSLYFGIRPTATVHYIDAGIDTGGILGSASVDVEPGEPLGRLRGRVILAGIDRLLELLEDVVAGRAGTAENPSDKGRQYFEMAPAIKEIVQGWLDAGGTPVADPSEIDPDDLTPAIERKRPDGPEV